MSDMYILNIFERKADLVKRDYTLLAENMFNRSTQEDKFLHLEFIVGMSIILDLDLR